MGYLLGSLAETTSMVVGATALNGFYDKTQVYTKAETDALIPDPPDLSGYVQEAALLTAVDTDNLTNIASKTYVTQTNTALLD